MPESETRHYDNNASSSTKLCPRRRFPIGDSFSLSLIMIPLEK